MRLAASLGLLFVVAVSLTAAPPAPKQPKLGIVVEEVGKFSATAKAGVQPSDVLLSWERSSNPPANPSAARGELRSPFDLDEVAVEQAPRGRVRLKINRGEAQILIDVPFDDWDIKARPRFSPRALTKYLQGRGRLEAKDLDKAVRVWRELATELSAANDHESAAWLLRRTAYAFRDADRPDDCYLLAELAISEAELSGKNMVKVQVSVSKADDLREFGKDSEALRLLTRLLESRRNTEENLRTAAILSDAGFDAIRLDDLDLADRYQQDALRIQERLAPGSISVATTFLRLGTNADRRSDPAAAETYDERALRIRERLDPGSIGTARVLQNLAVDAMQRNDLEKAERLNKRALDIRQHLIPGDLDVASNLTNLGEVVSTRGDLASAKQYWLKSLAMTEKQAPQHSFTALMNLANLERQQGDFAAADSYYHRALTREEKLSPEGPKAAWALRALGDLELERANPEAADKYYRRALAIRRKLTPEGTQTARVLRDVGMVAADRGDLATAIDIENQALAMRRKTVPDGLLVASSLMDLGDLASRAQDLTEAEKRFLEALSIYDRLLPETVQQASALHTLGLLERQRGKASDAATYLGRSVGALEKQVGKLGGTEDTKASFRETYRSYYQDYLDVLIELNRQREAADVLERSRARALLEMLGSRDLTASLDVSPELDLERRHAGADYDRAKDQLSGLSPKKDAEKIQKMLGDLQDIGARKDEIAERIKKASPKYASLQYPQPLDLAGAQAALDPGTLLLSYSVGKGKSFLFVISPDPKRGPPLSVFTLPIGEKALRESVEAFRRLIEWNKSSPELLTRSRSLYDTLLKPAEPLIARSDRLLILSDGPLHKLPWASLVRDVMAGQPRYVVEWKPIHTAVSATVYGELKKSRRQRVEAPAVEVVAFGDPRYPKLPEKRASVKRSDEDEIAVEDEEDAIADPQLRSVARGGFRFEPLPASRKEVEQIASLYAPKAAAYLGSDATEEKAKAIGKDVPLIHFACHAYVNERFPLDSALVFTIPEKPKEGQDNGLLQAWEIFEKVRIDADLVTLSACESGLGKEMGGEGLIGLTRAFQYAGARSILASLWKVEDASTGELMKHFYQYLKAGKTKDEALRLAQIDLIHSPGFSQPFHWAAFQLIGDWK
jgi:CHAT domain-containing protein/Tfp pilus assembly protein PilF